MWRILQQPKAGDLVVATGSAQYNRAGQLVCAMRVSEAMTYDEYWKDPRFHLKKPVMNSSLMRGYGDNIYHRSSHGNWIQADSHRKDG